MLKRIKEMDLLSKIILCLVIVSILLILLNGIKFYNKKVRESTYNIIILGDNPMTVYLDDDYVEIGYISYDYQNKEFNNIAKVTNNVDNKTIGTYHVDYEITNFFKKNKVSRIVNVVENPLDDVKFSLKGKSVIKIDRNTKYKEAGYNVVSNKGDFTKNVTITNNVDTSKVGVYDVIYTLKIGNKTKSIKRVVNVVGDKYSVDLDNENMTNKDVKILIKNNLKDFDYFINPNNIKIYEESFEFAVNKNDTYEFHIVDKNGIDEKIKVKIKNIDKKKPIGICNATIKDNKTFYTVEASDKSGIKEYHHDKVIYEKNSFVIDKIQENSTVNVYDNAGNIAKLKCVASYEYIAPYSDFKYKYESNTLKYWIENAGEYYKTTHIWVKDPYNQMKVAIPSKIGSLYTARTILNNEIKNMNYEEKGMVAINASGIVGGGFGTKFSKLNPSWVGTAEIQLIINDGKIIRDSTGIDTPDATNVTYGIKSNGYLGYYRFGKGNDTINKTKVKEQIINDGIKYTYGFAPVLVLNNKVKESSTANNLRQGICQINKNNFIIVTNTTNERNKGFSHKSLAEYMVKLNCQTGFNLDGGGSINFYYKGNDKNIYSIKNSTRGLVDLLYFVEK